MKKPDAATFLIESQRLAVELAWPGSAIQKGCRFDVTGHAVQVTLDGKHTYCAPEDFDSGRGSGGLGLCSEFWDYSGSLYGTAGVGEFFPKMGVGLIRRKSPGECDLMTPHETRPCPVETVTDRVSAVFTVSHEDCGGYSARLVKTVRVEDNRLSVSCFFENTGSEPLDLLEYNHNFICIDGRPIGPEYRLRLPVEARMPETPDVLSVRGNEITWKGVPDGAFYCRPEAAEAAQPFRWELEHLPGGAGLRETGDFPVYRFALWGKSHVVSPEVFVRLALLPGQKAQWTRGYEFFSA